MFPCRAHVSWKWHPLVSLAWIICSCLKSKCWPTVVHVVLPTLYEGNALKVRSFCYVASRMMVWSCIFGWVQGYHKTSCTPTPRTAGHLHSKILAQGWIYSLQFCSNFPQVFEEKHDEKALCLILFWKPITRKRIQNKTKDVDHPPRAFEKVPARMVRRMENGIAVRNSNAKISSAPSKGATGHCWSQKCCDFSRVQTYQ